MAQCRFLLPSTYKTHKKEKNGVLAGVIEFTCKDRGLEDREQNYLFDGRKGRHQTCRPARVQIVDGKSTHLVLDPTALHLDKEDLDSVAILCVANS